LKKKDFLLFFFLPFLGTALIFFVVSFLNRAYVQKSVEALTREQLQAAAEILKADIGHFLREGAPSGSILELYATEENIYFMALLDKDGNVLGWRSKFEGYLPLSLRDVPDGGSWVIDSPAGKILNLYAPFSPNPGESYFLYLGYSLGSLEEMAARSKRNFLLLFGIVAVSGGFIFRGVYMLHSRFEAKKAEVEETRAERERFREISAFTSGVAHEIKNPLNSLSLLCELLLARVPPELREDVSLGKAEVRKISDILDKFSDALKPLHLNKETFPFGDIVLRVLESLTADRPEASSRVRLVRGTEVRVNADRGLLSQVLLNLIKNALEASREAKVILEAEKGKKGVRIVVKDSGPGVPAGILDRIFEPFFSTKENGMGIGLFLSRKIVEAHGGRIEVRSPAGGGASFIIQVPGG
jgi:signal transduction histidine kinase